MQNVDLSVTDSVRGNRYVSALTGLRAIAAYLVFLHHYNPASPGTFAYRLFSQGYIGVSVFFILSGFLIYYRYADAYLAQKNWSWQRYLQNRFVRIFPLYTLLLCITVGINAMISRPISLPHFVLNITLLKGFFEEIKFSGIPQSWSLTVEICFYLLAPLLFICLRRWGAFWLTAGLVSTGLFIKNTVGQVQWHGLFVDLPFVLFYTFFGRAFEFVVGMWLARRWHIQQLPNYRFTTFGGILLIGACIVWQANVTMFTKNPTELLYSEVVVYNYVLPVGIGLVFTGLLREKSIIGHVLSTPVFQALGRSSYAFYLIHTGILASGLQKVGVTHSWLLFCLLVLIAYGLYLFVEKPLDRRVRLIGKPFNSLQTTR